MSERPWRVTSKRSDTELLDALERLVDIGACPGIINDDNGHWAVSDDGMQSIQPGEGPHDIETAFWITADRWRTSVREAINDYLDEAERERRGESDGR